MASHPRLALLLALLPAIALVAVPTVGGTSVRGTDPGPVAEAAPAEATVQIVGFHMVPKHLAVTSGTTVTWVNNEPIEYPAVGGTHQVTADDGSWASPPIAPGTRWSRRFDLPGTITYHSPGHSTAAGSIEVTGPTISERPLEREVAITEPNPDDPGTWRFEPADMVIETGTTVIWRNNGKSVHTVSADDKSFESGDIPPGTTWQHTFDAPGAFAYHCTPHPWMTAQVRIVAPDGAAPPPPPAAEHLDSSGPPASRPSGASPARAGRGAVRHEVSVIEPNPAKPSEWTFDPPALDVKVGDTVAWRNAGRSEHTVTGEGFDSGLLKPGATWVRRFDRVGLFPYACTPHPWMKAVVRVTELDAEALAPLRVASSAPTAPVSATPVHAAEAVRVGDAPVRHEALIVEPSMADAMQWGFDPGTVEARVGDTVVWQNRGTLQHTATADSNTFDSGMLDPGSTFEQTFDEPGVYAYHCRPHPWMKGVVRVTDAAGGEPPVVAAAPPTEAPPSVPDAATLRGAIVNLASPFRPSLILPIALAAAGVIVGLAWFLAGTPWRRTGQVEVAP